MESRARFNASALISFGAHALSVGRPNICPDSSGGAQANTHVALVNAVRLNVTRKRARRTFVPRDRFLRHEISCDDVPAMSISARGRERQLDMGFTHVATWRPCPSREYRHQPCPRFHEHVARFMSCGGDLADPRDRAICLSFAVGRAR